MFALWRLSDYYFFLGVPVSCITFITKYILELPLKDSAQPIKASRERSSACYTKSTFSTLCMRTNYQPNELVLLFCGLVRNQGQIMPSATYLIGLLIGTYAKRIKMLRCAQIRQQFLFVDSSNVNDPATMTPRSLEEDHTPLVYSMYRV